MDRYWLVFGLAWMLGASAPAEVVSIAALGGGGGYDFVPDFTLLSNYDRKTAVEGWEGTLRLFLIAGGERETYLNVNSGTTQYQGHYVWLTNKCVSGFGTYTSSKRSRSFGWVLRNDTGKPLAVTAMSAVYGQWGARNRLPDVLRFDCRVSPLYLDPSDDTGWKSNPADVFTTPFTNNAPDAEFPYLENRVLKVRPGLVPDGAYLSVRFTDTCPASGNNAHLGIAGFRLRFASSGPGFRFEVH